MVYLALVKRGILYACLAYLSWGIFPVYWKLLAGADAFQVIAHRVCWAFVFLLGIRAFTRLTDGARVPKKKTAVPVWYALAGVFIGINWFIYVWAVMEGRIVEASLGYFINPLLNVGLGRLVFGEKLRLRQGISLLLASLGVGILGFGTGTFPWVAAVLALSFSAYGIVKKKAPLDPVSGLSLETGYLALPALAFLIWKHSTGTGIFGHTGAGTDLLLAGAGVVTTIPLLFFAAAAPRIPFSLLGVLQFLSPTLQFLCGVLLYGEPFGDWQIPGFVLVWAGVLFFLSDAGKRRGKGAASAGDPDRLADPQTMPKGQEGSSTRPPARLP